MTEPNELLPNTPAQIEAHEAQEARAAEEATWPLFVVEISGELAEWVNRPGPHWMPNPENDREWIPRPADELPEGVSINENGMIQMPAFAVVTMRARNEDHAKMMALRDNPDYHTIVSVTRHDDPNTVVAEREE